MRGARMYALATFIGLQCFYSLRAYGQEEIKFPQAEISFGYSYLHTDTQWLGANPLNQQCAAQFGNGCPFTFAVHAGFNGWYIAPQMNFTHWFGVKAQISGQYGRVLSIKSDSALIAPVPVPQLHAYDILFGGVVSHRAPRVTLFAHGLFGMETFGLAASQVNVNSVAFYPAVSTSDTAFDFGGGVDWKIWKVFAIRAGQLDYQFVNTANYSHLNEFRYSGGMVILIGGN